MTGEATDVVSQLSGLEHKRGVRERTAERRMREYLVRQRARGRTSTGCPARQDVVAFG